MVRVKSSAVTSLATREFIDKIQNTKNLMEGDPRWASATPPAAVIQTALDNLDTLEVAGQNRDRTVIAQKRTARGTLTGIFLELCISLGFIVRNEPNAEELINGIGLETVKQGYQPPVGTLPVPFDLRSQVSQEPGAISLQWECLQRGVHSWVVEIADGADVATAQFRQLATTTTKKFKATELVRGNFYMFRIRCVGAKSSYSDPSEVTVCMAA